MANWVKRFLEYNPDKAAWPVYKRARHALYLRRPDGLIEANFTGKPCHYWTGTDWEPIDTAIKVMPDGSFQAAGVLVRISPEKLVSVLGKSYSQRTVRAGLFNPTTRKFTSAVNIPLGSITGDSLVASGDWWEHQLKLVEDGIRETLTILEKRDIGAKAADWLVLETIVTGATFPDGWLNEFDASDMHFPLPKGRDAAGEEADCRRYARNVDGVQYIYTGVPVTWLASAIYPVVIDPDFAGDNADGSAYGRNASYATANESPYTSPSTGYESDPLGQRFSSSTYRVYRLWLKFDTSSIDDGATITQVNLKLVATGDLSDIDFDIQIVKQDWSGMDPLSAGNINAAWDGCRDSDADDSIWRNTSGMSIDTQYTSGNLSTTWVSKTGATYYSLRSSLDKSATAPTGSEYIYIALSENVTEAYRPVLTVTIQTGTTHQGAAALSGAGTLAGTSKLLAAGASALSGSGTLEPVGLLAAAGRSALAGTGALEATGLAELTGAASLEGQGALDPTGLLQATGQAVLEGTGMLTGAGKLIAIGAAALEGSGTLTPAGMLTARGQSQLTGAGTLAAAATAELVGTAMLEGTGTLTSAATKTAPGRAALAGAGTLESTGTRIAPGAASLAGTGAMSPTGQLLAVGRAVLSATGELIATGGIVKLGRAVMTGVGTLTARGGILNLGQASMAGAGTLTASAQRVVTGAASLVGSGTVTAVGTLTAVGRAVLTGTGGLAAWAVKVSLISLAIGKFESGGNRLRTLIPTFRRKEKMQ